MKTSIFRSRRKLRPTEVTTQIQIVITGFIFSEIWHFSQTIASAFNAAISSSNLQGVALAICAITFLIVLLYAHFREVLSDLKWLWGSNRQNLVGLTALAVLGFCSSAISGGIGTNKYHELVSKFSVLQLTFLLTILFVIAVLFILKSAIKPPPSTAHHHFFLMTKR